MRDARARRAAWILPVLCALWVAAGFVPPGRVRGFDVEGFARLPVLADGRVKPVDTVARTSLLMMRGTQTLTAAGRALRPAEWLLEAATRPQVADGLAVFRIDDPGVLAVVKLATANRTKFAFRDLSPSLPEIDAQAGQADGLAAASRSRFQAAVVNLRDRLMLYRNLQATLAPPDTADFPAELEAYKRVLGPGVKALVAHQHGGQVDRAALAKLGGFFERYRFLAAGAAFRPLPPQDGERDEEWRSVGEGLLEALRTGELPPQAGPYASLVRGWRAGDAAEFNRAVAALRTWFAEHRPADARAAASEALFNRVAPFYRGMTCYVVALLLGFAAWAAWPVALRTAAFRVLALAWGVHTAGLLARIVLQGRPPVTNLYSSAVFVGWVTVGMGFALERRARDGVAALVAAAVGFVTLIIAHHLALQGDSMEMMRAVLDSNFWLTTHVVAVTTGYASTFLAGALGVYWVARAGGRAGASFAGSASLARTAYGVVCFSLFFSFTGTVLGGIWADQSWGRFWGWDPKENGALLIVLWNAVILHARWGRLADVRGFMVMTVVGNVITALSWFGVNMLGIGLHSYGWMDKAFWWLAAFVVSQVAVVVLGLRRR